MTPTPITSVEDFRAAAESGEWPILCDPDCRFTHKLLADLMTLWRYEAGHGIPARSALTARKLKPFMRHIALYERSGKGKDRRYRVRLMGSGIVQYYGELTGKTFEEAVPAAFLPRWYGVSDLPLLSRKPARLVLRADTFNKSHMVAEYLVAPLCDDEGNTKFVLVGICFNGRHHWENLAPEARRILGLEMVD